MLFQRAYDEGMKAAAATLGAPAVPALKGATPPTYSAANRQATEAAPSSIRDASPAKLPMVTGANGPPVPPANSMAMAQMAMTQRPMGVNAPLATPKVAHFAQWRQGAFNFEPTVTPDPPNDVQPDNGFSPTHPFHQADPADVVSKAFNSLNAQKPTDLVNGGGEAYVGSPGA